MANPTPRSTSERVAALLPLLRAFLAERYVTDKLVLKAEDVEELSGPAGSLVAAVITAEYAQDLAVSSKRLEKLTYVLLGLTAVLVGFELGMLWLAR